MQLLKIETTAHGYVAMAHTIKRHGSINPLLGWANKGRDH